MAYSYSQLRTYLYCPRRYEFHYIKGLSEDTSDILERGIVVHEAIAKNDPKLVMEDIENYVMFQNAREYLNFVKPIAFEVKLGITKDFKPAPYQDAFFHGIVDVIYEGGLLDWKTGQSKPDALQLLLNALIARINGYAIDEITYVYLHSNTSSATPYTEEMFEDTKDVLLSLVEDIENDTTFEARPSHKCYYCPYAEQCVESLGESVQDKLKKFIITKKYNKRLREELREYVKQTNKEVQFENFAFSHERTVCYRCKDKDLLKARLSEEGRLMDLADIPSQYYETLHKEGYDDIIKPYLRNSYTLIEKGMDMYDIHSVHTIS